MIDPVHVIGASGRSGLALCESLLADGISVLAVFVHEGLADDGNVHRVGRVVFVNDTAAEKRDAHSLEVA